MRPLRPLLRPVSGAGAIVLAAGLLAGPAAQGAPAPDSRADRERLPLEPDPASRVSAAELDLDAEQPEVARRGPGDGPGGPATGRVETDPFSQVAVTWEGTTAPGVHVRTRTDGEWTPWRELAPLGDGPGGAEEAQADRRGTELLWVGPSDGVQVRTTGPAREPRLVLIDPGREPAASARPAAARAGSVSAAPAVAPATTTPATTTAATTVVQTARRRTSGTPAPRLHSRRKWGADNRWRNGEPTYMRRLKQVHVHHTATGNGYSRRDVPGIIRGMYRYHTKNLGWFDIGYNFLVDRFGRGWVGRSGGPRHLVKGAHTRGFNHKSAGVAIIGNYQQARPSRRSLRATANIAAWKLDKHGRRAIGKVPIRSRGSDKYPAGTAVRLPFIDGHRDTGSTACPGVHVYDRLPVVRRIAQRRINRSS